MTGIKASANRPKTAKRLRGNSKTKRFRNDTEAQAKYKEKIALRRAKRKAKRGK